MILFAAFVVWIFYNTEVLNTVRGDRDGEVLLTDYEKQYKRYEKPAAAAGCGRKIRDRSLRPEAGAMTMHGAETVKNRNQPAAG